MKPTKTTAKKIASLSVLVLCLLAAHLLHTSYTIFRIKVFFKLTDECYNSTKQPGISALSLSFWKKTLDFYWAGIWNFLCFFLTEHICRHLIYILFVCSSGVLYIFTNLGKGKLTYCVQYIIHKVG